MSQSQRSVLEIVYKGPKDLDNVKVAGSWDRFEKRVNLTYCGKKNWVVEVMLPSGCYHWRFLVTKNLQSKWETASHKKRKYYDGDWYNVKRVKPPKRDRKRDSLQRVNTKAMLKVMSEEDDLKKACNLLMSNVVKSKDSGSGGASRAGLHRVKSKNKKWRKRKLIPPPVDHSLKKEYYDQLHKANMALQTEIIELQEKVSNSEGQKSKLEKIIAKKETKWRRENADALDAINLMRIQQEELKEKNVVLSQEKVAYESELEHYRTQNEHADEALRIREKELLDKNTALKRELKNQQDMMQSLREKNSKALQESTVEGEKTVEQMKEQIALLIESLNWAREELKQEKNTSAQMRSLLAEKDKKIQETMDLSLNLKTELADSARVQGLEMQHLREDNVALKKENAEMSERNHRLQVRIRTTHRRFSQDLEADITALAKSSEGPDGKIKQEFFISKKENTLLKDQLDDSKTELEIYRSKYNEDHDASVQYKTELDVCNKMLMEVKSTLEQERTLRETREEQFAILRVREGELNTELKHTLEKLQSKDQELAKFQALVQDRIEKNRVAELTQQLAKTGEEAEIVKLDLATQNNKRKDLERMLTERSEKWNLRQEEYEQQIQELRLETAELKKTLVSGEATQDTLKSQLQEKEQARKKVEQEMQNLETENQAVLSELQTKIEDIKKHNTLLQQKLQHHYLKPAPVANNQLQEKVQISIQGLRLELDAVRRQKEQEKMHMSRFFSNFSEIMTKTFNYHKSKLQESVQKYKQELMLRRKYFEIVQDLRGPIRCMVRVRSDPLTDDNFFRFPSRGRIQIWDGQPGSQSTMYQFSNVFEPKASQEEATSDSLDYAVTVLDGFNVCVVAFGGSKSGKSHTIFPKSGADGLASRVFKDMFELVRNRVHLYKYAITVSVYDVTNNKITDLLAPPREDLCLVSINNAGDPEIHNLSSFSVHTSDAALDLLKKANTARTVLAEQQAMEDSQLVIRVAVDGENTAAKNIYRGVLNIVLTGTFRATIVDASDEKTKCLRTLKRVLMAIKMKARIPHKESILTKALHLNAETKTVIYACCSNFVYKESKEVLDFVHALTVLRTAKLKGRGPISRPNIKPKYKPHYRT